MHADDSSGKKNSLKPSNRHYCAYLICKMRMLGKRFLTCPTQRHNLSAIMPSLLHRRWNGGYDKRYDHPSRRRHDAPGFPVNVQPPIFLPHMLDKPTADFSKQAHREPASPRGFGLLFPMSEKFQQLPMVVDVAAVFGPADRLHPPCFFLKFRCCGVAELAQLPAKDVCACGGVVIKKGVQAFENLAMTAVD